MTLNKEYGHTSRYGRVQPSTETRRDKQDCWISAGVFLFPMPKKYVQDWAWDGISNGMSLCYVIQLVPSTQAPRWLADSTPLVSVFFVRLYIYWPLVVMPAAAAAAWALAASMAFWSA